MKVQTEAIQFKADAKLLNRIDLKLTKLEKLFDRIIGAHVKLKLENSGQVKDKVLEIKIDVPGQILVASAVDKSFESALDEVMDSLKRQLLKYKDRLRPRS